MKFWDTLTLALLTLLSNNAALTFAQYVTTVTVSINTNPFCTSLSGLGVFGSNGSEAGGSGFGSGPGSLNGSASGTVSATKSSPTVTPTDTSTGNYHSLGYYAAPADGNVLGGPVFTNPLMTLELCGTDCQGYSYLALENGDECNCGSSAPSGPSYSSPPSKIKRQVTGSGCIPCGGKSAECCGAPGGYALVYQVTSNVESSSVVVYSTINSADSIIESSFTSYSFISSSSVVAYTSTGSDGSVIVGSTSSYVAVTPASTYVYNTSISDISSVASTTNSYAQTSASTYNYSTTNTAPPTTSVPIAPTSTGFGNGSSSGLNSTTDSTSSSISNGTSSATGSSTGNVTSSPTDFGTGNGTISATGFSSSGFGSYSNYTFSNTVITAATTTTSQRAGIAPAAHGGDSGATATTNNGATVTSNGDVEPTINSPTPSCVQSTNYVGNNTKYTDYFGYTYDIRCNLNVQSMPTDYEAHAESFEDCLEYCSLLENCIAVTYQDPSYTPSNSSNCYPKWSFDGYAASGTDGVYSGVNVNGASDGTLNDQNLCTSDNNQGMSYAGPPASTYTDDYGLEWTIGCNSTLAIVSRAALSSTVTDTLASCVDYCSRYESCEMVNWTGPHTNGTSSGPNCFPASSSGAAGAAGSAPGAGYAVLNPSSD